MTCWGVVRELGGSERGAYANVYAYPQCSQSLLVCLLSDGLTEVRDSLRFYGENLFGGEDEGT